MRCTLTWAAGRGTLALLVALVAGVAVPATGQEDTVMRWQIGTPIVTYWAGPAMTDAFADQLIEGGWNLAWCTADTLDVLQRHGLRGLLHDPLLRPESLDGGEKQAQLDALIERVRSHPALYAYHMRDEPNASVFPEWGRLVAYLREQDPAHLAYINLFPIYANNEQLGTQGDPITAYREHLRQYMEIVAPDLISYDHYHFAIDDKDRGQYFLNLAMIRQTALDAGVPFLNIVQACTWSPSMRIPGPDEMRFLVYTTLAYGAQGISYYVYCHPNHEGAIANADGTTTPKYDALSVLNREFVAIASELQPLQSLGVHHLGMLPDGCVPLPEDSPFRVDPPVPPAEYTPPEKVKGLVLSTFGRDDRATHVVVVNLDYLAGATTTVVGPGPLEVFDAHSGQWSASPDGERATVTLEPGGGRLLRVSE